MSSPTLSEQLLKVKLSLEMLTRFRDTSQFGYIAVNVIGEQALALMPSVIERVEALEADKKRLLDVLADTGRREAYNAMTRVSDDLWCVGPPYGETMDGTHPAALPVGDELRAAVAKALLDTTIPDGYDRNGSHESGSCQEYRWGLRDLLRPQDEWKAERLADAALAVAIPSIEGPLKEKIAELESELESEKRHFSNANSLIAEHAAKLAEREEEVERLRSVLGEALEWLDYMGQPRPFLFSARSYYERHGELPGHKGCLETARRIRQALARDGVAAENVTAAGGVPT